MSDAGASHTQFIREVKLIVSDDAGNGLDLSELRVTFGVSQSDFETPNTAAIRVWNPSDQTAQKVRKEYSKVSLQAGYRDGAKGIVFKGTIKQAKIGRDSQTDTYLQIFAAGDDEAYNFGMVNKSIAAGTPPKAQTQMIAQEMGVQAGDIQYDTGLQDNIRGKVLYGMGRTQLRNLARTGLATWSLQDGKVVVAPLTGYAKGEAVVINEKTGMVGLPEQTDEGIKITTLLNPKIVIGTQVQLDQASVQRASISLNPTDVNQFENAFPPVSTDGFYYVMVHEMEGDTRANEYYSRLVCLTINKTVPQGSSVSPAG